jgi:protein-S-isoprenylcysteine O-methyltransferase Ste14
MIRAFYVLLATAIYVFFFATFLYLIGFVAGLPQLPTNVDTNPFWDIAGPVALAIPIDIALITLFGLQHSVMARPGFKAAWTRIVPKPIERAIYVLSASLVLILLLAFWHPIAGTVWQVDAPIGRIMLWGVFAAGWGIVLLSTFLLNHFELFGLSQTIRNLRNLPSAAPQFRLPFFYKLVRHPLYSGFVIALWATPAMSYGHALLAFGLTVYILIAIQYEERDLIGEYGDEYRGYRQRVGSLMPGVGRVK